MPLPEAITDEASYDAAVVQIGVILDAGPRNDDLPELERLTDLVVAYEHEHYPIGTPTPGAVIEFSLDQLGLDLEVLAPIAGGRAEVEAILQNQRDLTPVLAEKIAARLSISIDLLLNQKE